MFIPEEDSKVFTLRYHIASLWKRAASKVAAYEQQPDAGLLPPTAARFLYRVLHFGLVFCGGSLLLLLGYVAVCGLASGLSLLLALLTVVWMPAVCLVYYLFTVLVYDLDSPEAPDERAPDWLTPAFWAHCCRRAAHAVRTRGWALLSVDSLRSTCSAAAARLPFVRTARFGVWRARGDQSAPASGAAAASAACIFRPRNRVSLCGELLLVRLVLRCLLEPLAAVALGVLVHPLLCALNLAFGVVRYCFRVVYDRVLFVAIIKPLGRVPAKETWMAKRVAGSPIFAHLYSKHTLFPLLYPYQYNLHQNVRVRNFSLREYNVQH